MKVTASLLFAFLAVGGQASSTASTSSIRKASDRELQNYNNYNYQQQANNQNYNGYNGYNQQQQQQQQQGNNNNNANYNGYQNGQGQQYENFEEYLQALMASRTFSFMGCSTINTDYYGSQTYVTYRLCDSCSDRNRNGCDDSNGDYVVNMREFSETYSEYLEQTTGQESSLFECMRVEEFQENSYMYGGGQNYNGQNYQQQQQGGQQQNYQNYQQQQYYNGQQNNQELFIGPKCTGNKKIELGVFFNEECTYPANKNVKDVLGFNPSNANINLQQCIACSFYNYQNGGGDAELNPLCERLLERSGRCDRNDKKTTEADKFWKDVVEFVNDGGSFSNYNDDGNGNQDYYEEPEEYDYYDNQQGAYNYNNNQGNRQLQNNNNMYYNQYQNSNTCEFIDSLPHSGGAWDRLKQSAANNGIGTGALVVIVLFGVAFAAFFALVACGIASTRGPRTIASVGGWVKNTVSSAGSRFTNKNVEPVHAGDSETPYRREEDMTTKPSVVVT